MMTDLESISGVGPARADDLEAEGYESAEDIAVADPDDLDDLFDSIDAVDLVERAGDAVHGDEDAVEEDEEQVDEDDGEDTLVPLDYDLTREQRYYLIEALVEEMTRTYQRNDYDYVEVVQDAIDNIIEDGGDAELTLDQLDDAYRSVSQKKNDVRSKRGTSDLAGDLNDLTNHLQSLRSENWQ
jgi:nucleotidyltransferase/DNA polymerase involved in DNA repair